MHRRRSLLTFIGVAASVIAAVALLLVAAQLGAASMWAKVVTEALVVGVIVVSSVLLLLFRRSGGRTRARRDLATIELHIKLLEEDAVSMRSLCDRSISPRGPIPMTIDEMIAGKRELDSRALDKALSSLVVNYGVDDLAPIVPSLADHYKRASTAARDAVDAFERSSPDETLESLFSANEPAFDPGLARDAQQALIRELRPFEERLTLLRTALGERFTPAKLSAMKEQASIPAPLLIAGAVIALIGLGILVIAAVVPKLMVNGFAADVVSNLVASLALLVFGLAVTLVISEISRQSRRRRSAPIRARLHQNLSAVLNVIDSPVTDDRDEAIWYLRTQIGAECTRLSHIKPDADLHALSIELSRLLEFLVRGAVAGSVGTWKLNERTSLPVPSWHGDRIVTTVDALSTRINDVYT